MSNAYNPDYWPGAKKIENNAFNIPPKSEAAPTVIPPKRGPKAQPKSMRLAGSSVLDAAGRRMPLEAKRYSVPIGPRVAPQKTTKMLRAAI